MNFNILQSHKPNYLNRYGITDHWIFVNIAFRLFRRKNGGNCQEICISYVDRPVCFSNFYFNPFTDYTVWNLLHGTVFNWSFKCHAIFHLLACNCSKIKIKAWVISLITCIHWQNHKECRSLSHCAKEILL